MRIILLGAPGSGKGTQADILKKEFDLEKLSTGDLLRSEIKENSDLGREASKYMEAGELVPDDIMIGIIEHKAVEFERNGGGFILDGFPRTIAQAEGLKKMLSRHNIPLDAAVHIRVPEEQLIKRLCARWTCRNCHAIYAYPDGLPENEKCKACGGELYQRDDDKKETIMNRLKVYENKTLPLLDFYKNEGLFLDIDGHGQIDEIFQRIKKTLT